MLRLPGRTDPLLGRPFALYDTVLDAHGQPVGVDVVYLVVGKLTGLLAGVRAGDAVEVWGPLGNGFPDLDGRAITSAWSPAASARRRSWPTSASCSATRGYGGQPAAAQRPSACRSTTACARRTWRRASRTSARPAPTVHLASDDGSLGFHGFVTQLLEQHAPPQHLVGCGPEPMLHALAGLAAARGTCPVTSRWRRRWPAASASASAA